MQGTLNLLDNSLNYHIRKSQKNFPEAGVRKEKTGEEENECRPITPLKTPDLNYNKFLVTTGLEHPELQSFILRELFSSNLHKQTLSFNLSTPQGHFSEQRQRPASRNLGCLLSHSLQLHISKLKPQWILSGKPSLRRKQSKADQHLPSSPQPGLLLSLSRDCYCLTALH